MQETKYYLYELFLPNGKTERGCLKDCEFSQEKITFTYLGHFTNGPYGSYLFVTAKSPNNRYTIFNIACRLTETNREYLLGLNFNSNEDKELLHQMVV